MRLSILSCVVTLTMTWCVAEDLAFLGRASCATSTCHGGVINQGPAWNHSLSTWVANDPHAGAGLLLRDEDSRRIVTALNPAADESAETYDNVLRSRCISCHATATPAMCQQTGLLDDAVLAEGVSCEACHGPAEQWLEPHVQSDWAGPRRFEPETGMTDTESIIGRSETCVRCHIGSRTADGLVRDMNHDLIAAGHPALRFDLLIYNENLPHHWNDASNVETKFNESATRLRNVGRSINLAAAASLSARRASDHLINPSSVPWPELADYDCFACHQSLSIREYRLPPIDKTKSPLHVSDGLPIWHAWHSINQPEFPTDRKTLEALSPHRSDPSQIAQSAPKLVTRFRELAARQLSETVVPKDALKLTLTQLQTEPPVDWHQAAIQYLTIDAALRDLANDKESDAQAKEYLLALRSPEKLLRFDPVRSSKQGAQFHSPATFDPEAFRTAILGVFKVQPLKTIPPKTDNSRNVTNER